jgi:hypothetical protein
MRRRDFLLSGAAAALPQPVSHRQISGVYPHLAMYNSQGECGTGAVVFWAGRLWVVTYSPHQPGGSDDKLYEIDEQLNRVTRPESIGGTPANRMIHRESRQLFIGPYAVDENRRVRAISFKEMFGRPTGNARHLFEPASKIYYATMEEGFYEVDVHTLAVRQLYEDANLPQMRKEAKDHGGALLPGYHGKGFYSGQGRLIYANNGEIGGGSLPPESPSGCLAEWDGEDWKVVRRNQFTEVTGPGGLHGNPDPDNDPVWAVGWDHRSLLLALRASGAWHYYRLPKASHTYDGAHGWNTEWPRIRDIGEDDLLMTMHGMLWRFPRTFNLRRSAGIAPRSTYLRVVADFERWEDRVVFGCDDTAVNEFFNTRRAKGKIAAPEQSQSNLWFVEPSRLDRLGPPIGRGAVWVKDDIPANVASGPFLFSGFDHRMLHLTHETPHEISFHLEVDRAGDGSWSRLREIKVPARGYAHTIFSPAEQGAWVRLKPSADCSKATAFFHYAARDRRPLAKHRTRPGARAGYLWARGEKRGSVLLATEDSLYELDGGLSLRKIEDPEMHAWMRKNLAPPRAVLEVDRASVVYTDESGRRWRLPKGDAFFDSIREGVRVSREVSTERDLFNAHGTFYELPANNAGGIAMIRPICTHNLPVHDYCSWRGLTVMSGLPHIALPAGEFVRSEDGSAALWLGVSDDLWHFGKPAGKGGPWRETPVKAGRPSDPYLLTGYDSKSIHLEHAGRQVLQIRLEIDITGTGIWVEYRTFDVPAGRPVQFEFPRGFNAYWLRTVALEDGVATALLTYS